MALALLDQMARKTPESADTIADASQLLKSISKTFDAGESNWRAARKLEQLAKNLSVKETGQSAASVMMGVAERLR